MSLSAKVSVKSRFKHAKREITTGIAHISSSFNNTKVAISDVQGNVIAWSSGGAVKFKGSKKSTPYAAQRASEEVAQKAQKMYGLKNIDVCVRGFGPGRDTAVRSLASSGLSVLSVKDVTPLAHGGCRPRKQRRV